MAKENNKKSACGRKGKVIKILLLTAAASGLLAAAAGCFAYMRIGRAPAEQETVRILDQAFSRRKKNTHQF